MQLLVENTVIQAETTAEILEVIPEDVYAVCNGKVIQDGFECAEFGLTPGSQIELVPRLLGGKVHGSLARAGKVKGQTPKVDAEDKKKAKTGPAKIGPTPKID